MRTAVLIAHLAPAAEDEGGPNKAIFGYEVPSLAFQAYGLQ